MEILDFGFRRNDGQTLRSPVSRHTGESRCPDQSWTPGPLAKAGRHDLRGGGWNSNDPLSISPLFALQGGETKLPQQL